ncbi:MAG: phytanoyl-CoA dioxygenase family protein [Actinomycetota bacterium]
MRVLHGPMATVLATRLRQELREAANHEHPDDFRRHKAHLVFEAVDHIAHSLPVVDLARSVLGDDVLLWDSSVPIAGQGTPCPGGRHRETSVEARGGVPPAVTVRVVLASTSGEATTIGYLPGSHRAGPARRAPGTASDGTASGDAPPDLVDHADAVWVELAPGQAVAHHPWLVIGDDPARVDPDRLGAVCVYVPDTATTIGRQDSAQVVSGQAMRSRFRVEPRLDHSLSSTARAAHRQALHHLSDRIVPDDGR